MRLNEISVGENSPVDVNVFIEISLGGYPIKYELDKNSGILVVDRFISTSMLYPGNYGFIPNTLSDDGDPVDVIMYNAEIILPNSVVSVRPIGVMKMEDDGGMDEKILAVPSHSVTRLYDSIKSYKDVPQAYLKKVEHFFRHYKDLEHGKWAKLDGWEGVNSSHKIILESVQRAIKA
ncbi:inorganic diphosphatase [Candidatus Liberibacter brunswickensis]|uniref:inorganic diphosphatase n=1 Tax=Candidatus Liberibacter brunswickensis TaxID=1968796 RepID=UPI002FE1A690